MGDGDDGSPTNSGSNTPLARMCSYYLDCIAQEGTGGVSVYAESQWPDYAELAEHPSVAGDAPLGTPEARAVLSKKSRRNSPLSHYVGYPVYAKPVRSRKSGWEGFVLQPLLLWAVTGGTLDATAPTLNLEALTSLSGADASTVMEESISLSADLGLDLPVDQLPDLDGLVRRLFDLRESWPWKEASPPDKTLITTTPLSRVAESGIYHRVIVLATPRSQYTRGLEVELGRLRDIPEADYAGTALGAWLHSTIESDASQRESPLLIEPLPLNPEQRQAVRQALENPLTVITGPPGTGKSQVVSSILINAAIQERTTLFASKNNKAVDVVETRVNALGPRPVLLRLGRGEHQANLSTYLASLLSATATQADRDRFAECKAEYHALNEREKDVQTRLDEVVALRNQVDTLEQNSEPVRGSLGEDLFARSATFDTSHLRRRLAALERAIDAADRARQPFGTRMVWPLVRQARTASLGSEGDDLADDLRAMGLTLPSMHPNPQLEEWRALHDTANERLGLIEHAAEYLEALERLSDAEPPERLARDALDLSAQISALSAQLWSAWLRIQPTRLDTAKRKTLSDYAATLALMANAGSEGRMAPSHVFRKYQQLFPEVVNSLPCWAVTNLSVRNRVPLTPGFFDLLVIDEASQCDIASLLPLLFRAKRVAVIGDPMQLRHVSSLPTRQDEQLLTKHDLIDRVSWSYAVQSGYDLATGLGRSEDIVELRDHHRSHADVIGFSNQEFYAERLRVVTRYDTLHAPLPDGPAVRWVDIQGSVTRPTQGGAVNDLEADAVVAELRRLVVEQGYLGSVGVVSPFREQANRVRDKVTGDAELTRMLAPALFLSDTVHRFQGDERDVMIFSPVISQGIHNGAVSFLRSSPNLFNVAVTRARAALVVVGDLAAAGRSRVDYLERFAQYVTELERARATPSPVSDSQRSGSLTTAPGGVVSEWEVRLRAALADVGIDTIPQCEVESYRLDLALLDGQRRLDIEVDGELYHRAWNGEHCRRDQLRTQRLIELGWDVTRFWVYQVRDDLDGCVARVKDWLAQRGSG